MKYKQPVLVIVGIWTMLKINTNIRSCLVKTNGCGSNISTAALPFQLRQDFILWSQKRFYAHLLLDIFVEFIEFIKFRCDVLTNPLFGRNKLMKFRFVIVIKPLNSNNGFHFKELQFNNICQWQKTHQHYMFIATF